MEAQVSRCNNWWAKKTRFENEGKNRENFKDVLSNEQQLKRKKLK